MIYYSENKESWSKTIESTTKTHHFSSRLWWICTMKNKPDFNALKTIFQNLSFQSLNLKHRFTLFKHFKFLNLSMFLILWNKFTLTSLSNCTSKIYLLKLKIIHFSSSLISDIFTHISYLNYFLKKNNRFSKIFFVHKAVHPRTFFFFWIFGLTLLKCFRICILFRIQNYLHFNWNIVF